MSDIHDLLKHHRQEHVLAFWDGLTLKQQDSLREQVEALNFDVIERCRTLLESVSSEQCTVSSSPSPLTPAPVTALSELEREALRERGGEEIRNGKVGVILVAGGQGSRLGYEGPKGCYPIGPIRQTSLFFYHARKILALERHYGTCIPLYVMTSPDNNEDTVNFFKAHEYFGLSRERVFFFPQAMWPAFTPDGNIILDAPDHIVTCPDGHGGMLAALDCNGCLADMQRRGLTTLFYFQVDNPLVDIADPAFIGFHRQEGADISIKVCEKRDPDEGLGVVVNTQDGKTVMVEYTELTTEQKNERREDGKLKYLFGSVAIHVFSAEFLYRIVKVGLPLHVAHKKISYCAPDGTTVKPEMNNGYKFEKFIFDCMAEAKKVSCLAFERADEFSPLKNAVGDDSPATCRRDLQLKWNRLLDSCGIAVPTGADGLPIRPIEIDPCYAFDFDTLRERLIEHSRASDPLILVGT